MTCSPVLTQLNTAVDDLDLPVDGEVLAQAFTVLDHLTAKISGAVGDFDSAELWDLEGATSMTSWLRARAGLSNRDAHRHSATARRLRACPVTRQAWLDGRLSGGQVQAVVANVNDRTAGLFAEHEAKLIPVLSGLDPAETAVAMRDWAAKAKAVVDDRDPAPEPGRAHLSPTLDGRGRLDADLNAEGYQVVRAAMRVAGDPKSDDDTRTPAEKRHDALVAVCRHFLDHQGTKAAPRHRPHMNITIDWDTLTGGPGQGHGHHADGTPVGVAEALRMACDATIHRVVLKGRSEVLDYGRATRTIPTPVFNALAIRDRGCRFPGCDRPTDRCDAHHVQHWTHGGPTDRTNLVLVCARHHTVIHRPGWTVELDPTTAVLTITDPTGRSRQTHPPPNPGYAA